MVVASENFYILSILTANVHRIWMNAQKSTLEDRTAYTHNTCFETFPFPTATPEQQAAIRTAMTALHTYRSQQMELRNWGITDLYNEFFHEPTSQLVKLHTELDYLVMQAYGFVPPGKKRKATIPSDGEILERLLAMNQAQATAAND